MAWATSGMRSTLALMSTMAEITSPLYRRRSPCGVVPEQLGRGDDGLDEVTVSTTTHVWWVRGGAVTEHSVDPARLGLELHPIESLRGGDAVHNAGVVRDIFAGATGAVRDAVLLNAGIALALTRPDSGASPAAFDADLRAAMDVAADAIDSGAAAALVDRWVAATRR
jgi:anthranilate phosphoribosyltransferase